METNAAPSDAAALSELLQADPLPWILSSDEPYARWVVLRLLLGRGADDPAVVAARSATIADEGVRWLVEDLPTWADQTDDTAPSATYAPNRLNLLADMGVGGGDFERVESVLDEMLEHQERSGRFQSLGSMPRRPKPEWGSLLCDTAAITDAMLRFGRGDDPRVQAAVARLMGDAEPTSQGLGWRCLPEERAPLIGGPARSMEPCPQITLEGVRLISQLPVEDRPVQTLDLARAPLEAWRRRETERPSGYGHGYQFKTVKWPNLWYDVLWVLETVGRFPGLWAGPDARPADRRSIAELAACLIEYNLGADGRVTPRRAYRNYERFSFGRKDAPSPFATARCLVALERVIDLTDDIRSVDVSSLPSTRDGAPTAVQPRRRQRTCPIPARIATHTVAQARARVLTRHRLGSTWESASLESLTADLAALNATVPTAPYVAYAARIESVSREAIDHARFDLRSLVTVRGMRGWLFVMRTDFAPIVFSATRRQTTKYAREYAELRGVTRSVYEQLRPVVLDAVSEGSLTARAIRHRLGRRPGVDVAALVNRLVTEGLLMRDVLTDGWTGHQWTFGLPGHVVPGLDLHSVKEEEADAALVRAYLRAFGPVSEIEASWWTGLGPRRTERALNELGDEVAPVRLHGIDGTFFMHASDTEELSSAGVPVPADTVFLPAYDPLMMGYAAKDRFVRPADRPRVFDRDGGSAPVVLCGGTVVGVWDLSAPSDAEILVHLFSECDRDRVVAEALRATRFLVREDTPVRFVDSMTPVIERPAGAVRRPLRD